MGNTNDLAKSIKNPKNTSLPSIITGFEAVAILIPYKPLKDFLIVGAPFLAWGFTVVFKSIVYHIESKRGVKVIEEAIRETQDQLNQNPSQITKKRLEKDVFKLREDLMEAKKAAIKIVIY